MAAVSFAEQVEEYRVLERRHQRALRKRDRRQFRATVYTADDPGHPLGVGMPLGRTMRDDGDSHAAAWMRVVRRDPCSYCGRPASGTVDHVEPRRGRTPRGLGGAHAWTNLTGACESCNGSKSNDVLLLWMLRRVPSTTPTKET